MKSDIHPENYRLVAFKDMSNDDVFITKSTVETKETTKIDGVEYPLFKLEISRTSHPYYTGKSKLVDTAGRVDKFRSKYADFNKASDVNEDTPVDKKQEIPESKTEAPAEEKAVEALAEEPAAEAPAEEPATEAPAEEPATEAPAEEPATEAPAEEPAAEESNEDKAESKE